MLLMLVLDVQGVGDLSLQHLDVVVADAVVRGQELLHKECDQPRVLTVHTWHDDQIIVNQIRSGGWRRMMMRWKMMMMIMMMQATTLPTYLVNFLISRSMRMHPMSSRWKSLLSLVRLSD